MQRPKELEPYIPPKAQTRISRIFGVSVQDPKDDETLTLLQLPPDQILGIPLLASTLLSRKVWKEKGDARVWSAAFPNWATHLKDCWKGSGGSSSCNEGGLFIHQKEVDGGVLTFP